MRRRVSGWIVAVVAMLLIGGAGIRSWGQGKQSPDKPKVNCSDCTVPMNREEVELRYDFTSPAIKQDTLILQRQINDLLEKHLLLAKRVEELENQLKAKQSNIPEYYVDSVAGKIVCNSCRFINDAPATEAK